MKLGILPSKLFKTVQIISPGGFGRRVCYSDGGFSTVTVVLSFSFYLFLLNLCKIIVNHRKILK